MLSRNVKEKFFVVPVKEYEALLDKLENEADSRALVKARKTNAGKPTCTLEEVKRELGMTRFGKKAPHLSRLHSFHAHHHLLNPTLLAH